MQSSFYTSFDLSDCFKRTSIVVVSSSFETQENNIGKRSNFNLNDDFNYIVGVLEERYNNTSNDSLPYHFIITRDGIIHNIKSPILTVPSKSALSLYENDCLILMLTNELSTATNKQVESLVRLMSRLSPQIGVKIVDSIFYPEKFVSNNEDKEIKDRILKDAINLRNMKDPIFSVLEFIMPNKEILINESLEVITTNQSDATLETIASQFGLTEKLMKELNPHIVDFVSNQYIFIPSTFAIKSMKNAIKNHKFLYSLAFLSKQILREGLGDE